MRLGAAVRAALSSLVLIGALSVGGCAALGAPSLAGPAGDLEGRLSVILDDPGLAGTRWGMMAMTLDGQVLVDIRADDRFSPASNTKIFATATAFALLQGLDAPDPADGTSIRLEDRGDGGAVDVVLVGAGDPALGDGPACMTNCLAQLADAVATRTLRVGDVIGDDRLYPDERRGPGWAWEDMQEGFGTAVSALTVNDNIVVLQVSPGVRAGAPVQAAWRAGDDLLPLVNTAVTVAEGEAALRLERRPGEDAVRLYGRMPVGGAAIPLRVGLDDPARMAAMRFRSLLEARGVTVDGTVRTRHRPLDLSDDPARGEASPAGVEPGGVEAARLARPPLLGSLTRTAKFSQNLHAELMLRRLGRVEGAGSSADGLAQVRAMLATAGIQPSAFDLYDGSGLSAYNRVSPRATATFLLWTSRQPWGEAWRATLPVGGRDGTLARRFVDTPLEGRIFAKTGTLNGVNALAGFLTAASGRTLVVAIYANDRPSTAGSATEVMDLALVALAAGN
ncbi:D-alanyl-D-alanine carboxypeptidase/D-alanyl-D-alanine-endopeptidase [Brevundimonas sp.]|uniref:D-alanyl-D-alanine carboxypeptidase/D-alanyl-D-alanine endopeptidase n=1 Tax=Brevundimonas sp. TaxID=1871086 RepID=UPI002604914D|nr:D-alanyl-D-alanine carboxypeptidase/D-alanyl-D-alanine-endopeptidase [Brevundimonas sp.]